MLKTLIFSRLMDNINLDFDKRRQSPLSVDNQTLEVTRATKIVDGQWWDWQNVISYHPSGNSDFEVILTLRQKLLDQRQTIKQPKKVK